jgi:hypothetical protein
VMHTAGPGVQVLCSLDSPGPCRSRFLSSEPLGCNQDRFYCRYTIQMACVTVRARVFQALPYFLLAVVFVYGCDLKHVV